MDFVCVQKIQRQFFFVRKVGSGVIRKAFCKLAVAFRKSSPQKIAWHIYCGAFSRNGENERQEGRTFRKSFPFDV